MLNIDQKIDIVIDRLNDLLELAESKFDIVMPKIEVIFTALDTKAGLTCKVADQYFLKFHDQLMILYWEEFYPEVLIHEIAHVVCCVNPVLGKNHDRGWKQVSRQLGGSGDQHHSMLPIYDKGITVKYITTTGHPIHVNEKTHNTIQNGKIFSHLDLELLNQKCQFSIIAINGQLDI